MFAIIYYMRRKRAKKQKKKSEMLHGFITSRWKLGKRRRSKVDWCVGNFAGKTATYILRLSLKLMTITDRLYVYVYVCYRPSHRARTYTYYMSGGKKKKKIYNYKDTFAIDFNSTRNLYKNIAIETITCTLYILCMEQTWYCRLLFRMFVNFSFRRNLHQLKNIFMCMFIVLRFPRVLTKTICNAMHSRKESSLSLVGGSC